MSETRAIDCGCGHKIQAKVNKNDKSALPLGEKLFHLVREHVDENHPDLNWSNKQIWIFLAEKSYTPMSAK